LFEYFVITCAVCTPIESIVRKHAIAAPLYEKEAEARLDKTCGVVRVLHILEHDTHAPCPFGQHHLLFLQPARRQLQMSFVRKGGRITCKSNLVPEQGHGIGQGRSAAHPKSSFFLRDLDWDTHFD